MRLALYILIGLFGGASYAVGIWQIIRGKYRPNVFSRVVWLLLAVNSVAAVLVSKSSKSSVLLALIFLVGNAFMCVLSFWKGTYEMGKLEYICLLLLLISAGVWLVFRAPLVNLSLGLLAHFIGAQPTYRRAWRDDSSESAAFWSLFFMASLLTIFASLGEPVKDMIFAIYFTLFDGSMTVLSLQRPKV